MAAAADPLGLPSWLRVEHPAAVRDRLRAETAAEQAQDAAWHVTWPADVAPRDVQQWLRQQPAAPAEAARIAAWLDDVGSLPTDEAKALCAAAARAYRAHRAVEQDRRTPALAVPTTREAHDLVASLNHTIGHRRKNGRTLEARRVKPEPHEPLRFEILRREKPSGTEQRLATLTVSPTDGADRLQGKVITTLKKFLDPTGTRYLAALLLLFHAQGARSGTVKFTFDGLLSAMGYSDRARNDPAVRAKAKAMLRLLTQLELAVYHPSGEVRARQPLLAVATKFDRRNADGLYELDGLELRFSPWFYGGVRDYETQQLGRHWFPTSAELPTINEGIYRYAIGLGLVLAARWHWARLDGKDHLAIRGSGLLAMAGITVSSHDTGKSWSALRSSLEELQRRNALGAVTWDGAPFARASICRLYPPPWIRDRVWHGVPPIEPRPAPPVATGADLKAWRAQKGLSQAATAKALEVGIATLKRAERAPDAPLGHALREALRRKM
jgi:hypothetical protein